MYGRGVRVSTFDQNPKRQLEGTPVARLFTDKASGKDTQRPQLEALLGFARTGDTVVVHSMDRLARNLDDLRRIVRTLTQRGISIEFVKEHLCFTGEDSPMANMMLSVMGAFAEFERSLIRERQREGIALAKQRGVYRDRKQYTPEFKREAVALVITQGHGYAEAARLLNINVSVLRRWEKEQRDHRSQAFPGQGHQLPEREEIARLKRELKRAQTEIEILKKATAYFARETL